jgi:hypothetical protein
MMAKHAKLAPNAKRPPVWGLGALCEERRNSAPCPPPPPLQRGHPVQQRAVVRTRSGPSGVPGSGQELLPNK